MAEQNEERIECERPQQPQKPAVFVPGPLVGAPAKRGQGEQKERKRCLERERDWKVIPPAGLAVFPKQSRRVSDAVVPELEKDSQNKLGRQQMRQRAHRKCYQSGIRRERLVKPLEIGIDQRSVLKKIGGVD